MRISLRIVLFTFFYFRSMGYQASNYCSFRQCGAWVPICGIWIKLEPSLVDHSHKSACSLPSSFYTKDRFYINDFVAGLVSHSHGILAWLQRMTSLGSNSSVNRSPCQGHPQKILRIFTELAFHKTTYLSQTIPVLSLSIASHHLSLPSPSGVLLFPFPTTPSPTTKSVTFHLPRSIHAYPVDPLFI